MKHVVGVSLALLSMLEIACADLYGPDEEGLGGSETSPIIGGTTASAYLESALIGMSKNGRTVAACSGSVIAPKVVLTAGHCVAGFNGWTVRAPFAQNQSGTTASGETFDWRDTGSPNVDPNSHDIGLIYLDTAINLAQYPLLADRAVADGSSVVNVGRINNGTLSNSALFVSKPITVRNAASRGFPFDYIATEVIESGDSGGPVELPGTALPHTIVAVNSGAGGGTEVLARVDLLGSWIAGKIAAHGGGGGGGPVPPMPPVPPGPTPGCSGPSESEPNDNFQAPNALGPSVCGKVGGGDTQDWFGWSISGALPYSVKLTATGDATINMWKLVSGRFSQVAATSTTEISHTASGAGSYIVSVSSPSGAAQSYSLSLTK
jgi:hypothetical protein